MSGGRGDGGNANMKKVVEGMTQVQQAPSTLLTRRFVKYLSSGDHVDATYAACLERYKEEQSTDVLLCVTLLIRQYLSLHPPSVVMMHTILTFVRDLMKHDSNSYAGRSLMHLENAIIAHSETLKSTDLTTWKQLMDESTPLAGPSPGQGTMSRTSSKGSFHSSMSVVSHTTPRAQRKRRSVANAPPIAGPGWRAASIEYEGFADISNIAGHQWKPYVKNRYKGQAEVIPYETLISCDTGSPADRPKPQGGPQLFQYHYYKDQVPLDLPKSEIDKMLVTLSSVPGSISGMGTTHSEVELAEKLLIKVLCDSYASHLKSAMSSLRLTTLLALSLLKDLVASPYICVRKTAFNIVLNLSIHINLLEDQQFFSESQQRSSNVLAVHSELVWLLHELILHLVQWDEEDDSVWHSAMVCWLSLTGDPGTGFPTEQALADIDVRALKRFTEVPKVTEDEAVLGSIVKMLYAALVVGGKLDSVKMDLLGGWRAIVDLMLTVHSWGARTYCFNLIYHHVSEQMMAQNDLRGIVPPEQERAVLDNVLCEFLRTDLHWCLPAVFKYPTDFHQPLLQYLTSEGPIREGYNRGVAQHVLQHIQGLALEYARLPKVIREDIKNIYECDDTMFLSMKQLSTLAQSNSECRGANIENRALAARWLFTLTKHSVEAQQPQSTALRTHVEDILSELTRDRIHNIRLLFLGVTESYLLLLKSREADHSTVIDALNKSLMVMVKNEESHPQVLLKMFHIIVEFTAVVGREPKAVGGKDTVAEMLAAGCFEVPHTLLLRVKTELLMYIFTKLGSHRSVGVCSARHAALLLLIAQVTNDRSLLSCLGGKAFFEELLTNPSRRLRLAASIFLINYCTTSEPKLWHEATRGIPNGTKIDHPCTLAKHLVKYSQS